MATAFSLSIGETRKREENKEREREVEIEGESQSASERETERGARPPTRGTKWGKARSPEGQLGILPWFPSSPTFSHGMNELLGK